MLEGREKTRFLFGIAYGRPSSGADRSSLLAPSSREELARQRIE